ncbi:hypothetical protein E4T39_06616 [Aureobasidium subglaciale]|nr:hypothetical protein E4T39_06616 [Aureobasidium subglaciale]
MSFSATGVPKPLQSRPKKSPIQLLRSASSPFGNHPRRKVATTPQAGIKRTQSEISGFAIGEGVILVEDWINTIQDHPALSQELKEKYAKVLEENTSSYTVPASLFLPEEVSELIAAGFMTSTSVLSEHLYSLPGTPSAPGSSSLANSWSTAATGTLAATGGSSAVHLNGGGGRGLPLPSSSSSTLKASQSQNLTFSLPYTGAYLRLLTEARTHFLSLLVKSSPKYKQSTREMLRERWNGGIPLEDAQSRAKRARGEWSGVLPGKTKKWKQFHGVEFEWMLEECLGSGGVECFETGSVGLGVRLT